MLVDFCQKHLLASTLAATATILTYIVSKGVFWLCQTHFQIHAAGQTMIAYLYVLLFSLPPASHHLIYVSCIFGTAQHSSGWLHDRIAPPCQVAGFERWCVRFVHDPYLSCHGLMLKPS